MMSYHGQGNHYLEVILGPMFSGKTTKLLDLYKQYTFCHMPVLVINHACDKTRFETQEEWMSSHDEHKVPCVYASHLYETRESIWSKQIQVVLINEGQFFDDLYSFVSDLLQTRQTRMFIYVSGLDGDSQRRPFGQMLDLIPLCDKVSKLTSLCGRCRNGTPGLFSLRLKEEKEIVLVGGYESYMPVCRSCYN